MLELNIAATIGKIRYTEYDNLDKIVNIYNSPILLIN